MLTGHVFIAMSFDGFIARPDGSIDWLLAADGAGEDHGYHRFMAGVDGVAMGRGTFETVRDFDPWPYEKPVVVLSRTLSAADVPERLAGRVEVSTEGPRALFERLEQQGWRRAYVDGGAVIRSFLAEGLVADMILTRVPVLIGAGRPLFGALARDLPLVHEATQAFPSGLVQSRYRLEAANQRASR
jgi:dihydrofolate reductase